MTMPCVQVETLPSPSFESISGAAVTPTLKTPNADHEAFLRRPELSPVEAPDVQARTSALISKVETKIVPRLKEQDGATAELENQKGNTTGHAVHCTEQLEDEEKKEAAASASVGLMDGLTLYNESTYTSGVVKELYTAKECLKRAETMLLVQRKAHDSSVEEHHDVRSLLQRAGELLSQAQDELQHTKRKN